MIDEEKGLQNEEGGDAEGEVCCGSDLVSETLSRQSQ